MGTVQPNEIFSRVVPPEKTGIGGWLYVLLTNLALLPISSGIRLARVLYAAVSREPWTQVASLHTAAFRAMWVPYLVIESLFNLLLLMGSIAVVILFLMERRVVPKLIAGCFAMVVIHDWFVVQYTGLLVRKELGASRAEALSSATLLLMGEFVAAVAWVLYLRFSKRVKTTFVT